MQISCKLRKEHKELENDCHTCNVVTSADRSALNGSLDLD